MRKLLLSVIIMLSGACFALAQSAGDYPKVEVYGGYSLLREKFNASSLTDVTPGFPQEVFDALCSSSETADIGPNLQRGFFCSTRSFHGFDASVTYNVSRYLGVVGNVTGHFKSARFLDGETITTRERIYNFLGGVQVKNNRREARFKPFAHVLAGAARYSDDFASQGPGFSNVLPDRVTSFAMKVGGGLDVRLGPRLDLRLVEIDFNPVFTRDRTEDAIIASGPAFTTTFTGRTQKNFTVGFGLAFH